MCAGSGVQLLLPSLLWLRPSVVPQSGELTCHAIGTGNTPNTAGGARLGSCVSGHKEQLRRGLRVKNRKWVENR